MTAEQLVEEAVIKMKSSEVPTERKPPSKPPSSNKELRKLKRQFYRHMCKWLREEAEDGHTE